MNNEQDGKKEKDVYVRVLTIGGFSLLVIAFIMPFIVKSHYMSYNDYKGLSGLGSVGDFIGGTTVAFLTAASVILLLATIIMQRKEIKISQQSIDELVKQTEASVNQAEEAKKETQIANVTMKRQQFETTFFNMINLQHTILNEIKFQSTGREAIKEMYGELKKTYYQKYSDELRKEALLGDKEILEDLIKKWYIEYELSSYKQKFEEDFYPLVDEYGEFDTSELDEFYESLENGTDEYWNDRKKDRLEYFDDNIKGDLIEQKRLLEKIDFEWAVGNISNKYVEKFKENYMDNPLKELKISAYEDVYKENENIVGHYYRCLYRLVKLIQEETFDSDVELNEKEKKKYRGILRAQLSSFELLMIFYNVVYSTKGEKFKEILINTNFFDDHLITKDFIWSNDFEERVKLDPAYDFSKEKSVVT